ncbi:MAG: S-layer homology domain-containing protein [Peptococcaceae bacterium]|nr:S-layer homology domain-containing protein [Peptococcaceae bacterium]
MFTLKKALGIPLVFLFLFLLGVMLKDAAAFSDTPATWPEARQAIDEMSAAGMVKGYEDGTYKPDRSVSKLEVVALLIRALGLEDRAKALDKAAVDYQMPAELYWGRGYLIAAVERGMLDKNHLSQLKPASPASRAEVAVLIFHALKLEPDETPLTFGDAALIPDDYRSCVAAVVKRNIMVGLPGNVFKPNETITRAQMAVLLARLIEKGMADPYPGRWVTGTLSSYDGASRQVTVRLSGDTSTVKVIGPSCAVYRDGAAASLADLVPGQRVRMVLDSSDKVVFLRLSGSGQGDGQAQVIFYKGRFLSAWLSDGVYNLRMVDLDNRNVTYKVASGVKVYRDGAWKEVFDLSEGDYIEIKVQDGAVSEITAPATDTARGEVVSVSSTLIKVEEDDGAGVSFTVPAGVLVEEAGATGSIAGVKKGDRVKVTAYGGQALKIEILSGGEGDVSGRIRALDKTGDLHITIRDDSGDDRLFAVEDDAAVYRDGGAIDFEDLLVGEYVNLELDSGDRVTRIEAPEGSVEISGEIQSIDKGGVLHVTVRDSAGDDWEFAVDSGVDVYRDGDRIDFADLSGNDFVIVKLGSRGKATRIEVTDEDSASTVSGTVTALTTGSSPRITVKKSNGSESRYSIASTAKYYRDGSRVSISELPVGCEVKLTLADGKAGKVEITDDQDITLEGEITGISTSRGRITIRQDSGNEFTYYLAGGARLRDEDGSTLTISELRTGWEVEIQLRDGEIYRLNVKDK